MTIEEQIRKILETENADGLTKEEIGKKHSVDSSYVGRLLNGERKYSGITIETLMKMFPRATLNMNGDASLTLNGTNNGVVGVNIGTGNAAPPLDQAQIKTAVDAFRHAVIDALIGLDIPPDALAVVLRTIKETKT